MTPVSDNTGSDTMSITSLFGLSRTSQMRSVASSVVSTPSPSVEQPHQFYVGGDEDEHEEEHAPDVPGVPSSSVRTTESGFGSDLGIEDGESSSPVPQHGCAVKANTLPGAMKHGTGMGLDSPLPRIKHIRKLWKKLHRRSESNASSFSDVVKRPRGGANERVRSISCGDDDKDDKDPKNGTKDRSSSNESSGKSRSDSGTESVGPLSVMDNHSGSSHPIRMIHV